MLLNPVHLTLRLHLHLRLQLYQYKYRHQSRPPPRLSYVSSSHISFPFPTRLHLYPHPLLQQSLIHTLPMPLPRFSRIPLTRRNIIRVPTFNRILSIRGLPRPTSHILTIRTTYFHSHTNRCRNTHTHSPIRNQG